jgi:hypothetical protein
LRTSKRLEVFVKVRESEISSSKFEFHTLYFFQFFDDSAEYKLSSCYDHEKKHLNQIDLLEKVVSEQKQNLVQLNAEIHSLKLSKNASAVPPHTSASLFQIHALYEKHISSKANAIDHLRKEYDEFVAQVKSDQGILSGLFNEVQQKLQVKSQELNDAMHLIQAFRDERLQLVVQMKEHIDARKAFDDLNRENNKRISLMQTLLQEKEAMLASSIQDLKQIDVKNTLLKKVSENCIAQENRLLELRSSLVSLSNQESMHLLEKRELQQVIKDKLEEVLKLQHKLKDGSLEINAINHKLQVLTNLNVELQQKQTELQTSLVRAESELAKCWCKGEGHTHGDAIQNQRRPLDRLQLSAISNEDEEDEGGERDQGNPEKKMQLDSEVKKLLADALEQFACSSNN